MKRILFFPLLLFYLCPIWAQIDSISIVDHGSISTIHSPGYWDSKYGISFPAYSVSIYNNYKKLSYSLSEIQVNYKGNNSLTIYFPTKPTIKALISDNNSFMISAIYREEFFVEGKSRKTLDPHYKNKILLSLEGENARGEALFNRNPKKHSYRILEPLIGRKNAQAVLQDSSFYKVIKGDKVDTLIDKGPYHIFDTLRHVKAYRLPIPKGWERIAYSTGEIILVYPKGERIILLPTYNEPFVDCGDGIFVPDRVIFYESGKIPFPVRETLRKNESFCSLTGHYSGGFLNILIRNKERHINKTLEIISSSEMNNLVKNDLQVSRE